MSELLITGGTLINDGVRTSEDILVRNGRIETIGSPLQAPSSCKIISNFSTTLDKSSEEYK